MPALTIEALTTSEVDGTGIFDKLMKGVEAHIQQEFNKNRIKGPEYATVYLGALQSTLDQSIRFLAQKDDALLKEKQALLIDKQIEEMTARIQLTQQQAANALTENATMLLQQDKLNAELLIMAKQELKTVAETTLLDQKTLTEKAQVDGVDVADISVLGRQMLLYKNQAEGFIRDSEQKATKIMTETYNIRHSMDSGGTPPNGDNRLQDKYVGGAIDKLLQGVSVDVATLDSTV